MRDLFSSSAHPFRQEPLDRIYMALYKYNAAKKDNSLQTLKLETAALQLLYDGRPYVEIPALAKTYDQQMAVFKDWLSLADKQNDAVIRQEALFNADRLMVKIVKTMGAIRSAPIVTPSEYMSPKECATFPNIASMVNVKEALKPLTRRPIDQLPEDFHLVEAHAKRASFIARLFVDIRGLTDRNKPDATISDETFAKIMQAIKKYGLSDSLTEPFVSLQVACKSNDRGKILEQCSAIIPLLEETASQTVDGMINAYDQDTSMMRKKPCTTDVPFYDTENQHPLMRQAHRMRWNASADALGTALDSIAYEQGKKAAGQSTSRA